MTAPLPSSTTWVDILPGTSLTQSLMDDIQTSLTAAAASATAAAASATAAATSVTAAATSATAAATSATAAATSATAAATSATAAATSATAAATSATAAATSATAAATSATNAAASATAAANSVSNLNASNLTSGIVPDARFPATLPVLSGINLTALNATNLASGIVPDARFPATLPVASGINLTALNAANLASGTILNARLPLTLAALGNWGGPNLLVQSQDLDLAPWANYGATVTADTTLAPDGTLTADTVVRTASLGDARTQPFAFLVDGPVCVVSWHLKQGTSGATDMLLYNDTLAAVITTVRATWTAGVPSLSILTGTPTLFTPVALDNGWYRVAFSASTSFLAASIYRTYVEPAAIGANGDTTIVWGAQVEPNSVLTPYVATTTVIAGGINLTALNAANLVTGTVPDARFPATLPALSGINLTALNASNLGSGTVPTARLGTGTASASTILYGDQTYKTAPVSSGWTTTSITTSDLLATSNSTTYQTIAAFTVPTVNGKYRIRGVLFFFCSSGQGIKIQVTATTVSISYLRTNVRTDVSLLSDEIFTHVSGPQILVAVTSTVTQGFVEFDAIIVQTNGTGAAVQFAQNAAGAATPQTGIAAGSYVEYLIVP